MEGVRCPFLDLNLGNWQAEFHAFGEADQDIERTFNLRSGEEWSALYEFLVEQMGGESV